MPFEENVLLWREDGPNEAPVWTKIQLDWRVATWKMLGLGHGDVLVVQKTQSAFAQSVNVTAVEWL